MHDDFLVFMKTMFLNGKKQIKDEDLINYCKSKQKISVSTLHRNIECVAQPNNQLNVIRIVQWNVLAKGLCCKDIPECSFNKNTPNEVYDWDGYRKWRLMQQLIEYKGDILCLEECDCYEIIKPFMELIGYSSVFCPKYDSPCLGYENNIGPDGCAIFFKKDKFKLNSLKSDNICEDKVKLKNHSQVFIVCQLKHVSSGKTMTIVCVHLKAGTKAENVKTRSVQTEYLLKMLKRHLHRDSNVNYNDNPIFICGDFNGESNEQFYSYIANDEIKLTSVYTNYGTENYPTKIQLRDNKGFDSRAIDYIFYTQSKLKLLEYFKLLNKHDIDQHTGFPNLSNCSDHIALIADFELL